MRKSVKYLKIFCNLFVALLIVLFIVFALPRILAYFMPFVIGFIFSSIANPLVRFLEKKLKIKRKYGFVVLIVLVIAAIVLISYGVGMALMSGIESFFEYFPTMYANAEAELIKAANQLQSILDHIPFVQGIDVDKIAIFFEESLGEVMSGGKVPTYLVIGGFAKSLPNVFVSSIMGLIATYFFIVERDKFSYMAVQHLPKSFRESTNRMYRQLVGVVGGYFKAQFKIMGVIYVVVAIGLLVLGVDYAWLIGFGIAFLDMLPIFGTGTVLCPWVVIKLFSGNYSVAIGMLALYVITLIVHQAIQPKLVGDSIGMNPFAALFFMYVGYQFSSVIGMIVAIPVGMILLNLFRAGAFDNLVWCIKEIVTDFNDFRKINKE